MKQDSELIKKSLAGDTLTFGEIVNQYQRYLFAAILPIVGDRDIAQDILQEAFLQAYRALPSYRGSNLKSWLARIAVNKAIDWQRKSERRSRLKETVSKDPSLIAVAPSSEDQVLVQDGYVDLAKAVSQLPNPYKRVFLQRYAVGCDLKTIAASEAISIRTVESRLYRARRMLKEVLHKND